MGQNQEIEIDVSENMEPGSSSNEENGIKRRGPSPESKLSDTGLFKCVSRFPRSGKCLRASRLISS